MALLYFCKSLWHQFTLPFAKMPQNISKAVVNKEKLSGDSGKSKLSRESGKSLLKNATTNDSAPATTQAEVMEHLILKDPSAPPIVVDPKEFKRPCPKGLEGLQLARTSLIVIRRPENAIRLNPEQRLLAFAQYDIVSEDGRQLFMAVEETTAGAVRWRRDARHFTVTLYDHSCVPVLKIHRPCSVAFCCAQYYCLMCTYGFKGCGNEAVVTLVEGNKTLGRIAQTFSCKEISLQLYDVHERHIISISGNPNDGILDVVAPEDEDDPVAMIESSMTLPEVSSFYKIAVSSYEDPYGLTFLSYELHPSHKAMILSAIILMDYIFCKGNSDYPHWSQALPQDFLPEDRIQEKCFQDGSKEIIVTSMKPRRNKVNANRVHRKCGCLLWFCSFICLCVPLGWQRNGGRCLQLIIFAILIVLGVVAALGTLFGKK